LAARLGRNGKRSAHYGRLLDHAVKMHSTARPTPPPVAIIVLQHFVHLSKNVQAWPPGEVTRRQPALNGFLNAK
jgi:hypothetical protein